MAVTSIEVYDTDYKITTSNNKLEFVLTDQQLKELGLDTQLIMKVENLYNADFVKYKNQKRRR